MEKRNLKEITCTDSLALTSIIDYWKDYDASTVLLAYAELKGRNYSLNEALIKRLKEFCAKNSSTDIDSLLSSALKNIGYNSYDECYEKEIGANKKTATEGATTIEIGSSISDNTEQKYPALRTISGLFKVFGWINLVATIIAVMLGKNIAVMLGKNEELGIVFSIITLVIGLVIFLGVFATAESIIVFIDIEENTRNNKT